MNPIEITCLVTKVDDNWLWHKRFCHINFDSIVNIRSMFAVRYFPKIVKPTNTICKESILAKHFKTSFPNKKFTTTTKLDIMHTNLNDPTKTKGFFGERYFII